MVIDFEKIAETHLEGFKGGKGKLDTRNFVDDKVKIMYSTLRPGSYHRTAYPRGQLRGGVCDKRNGYIPL